MAEMKPTPAPAIKRPTTMTSKLVAAVSRIHPTEKTEHPMIIVHRRPILSAISPEMMAPKKVPQERIPVRRDCCHPGRTKAARTSAEAPAGGYWEQSVSHPLESLAIQEAEDTYRNVSQLSDVEFHSHNTSHPSSIISEKYTTKGRKSAHEVCLERDRRLDTGGVIRPTDYSSSSHCEVLEVSIEEKCVGMVVYLSGQIGL